MPIVKRPGKQIAPSFVPSEALPEPGFKRVVQGVGAVKQQFGATLAELGPDFVELASQVHKTNVREDLEDAKLVYDESIYTFLAEQEGNTDYATWEDATALKHDTLTAETENNMRTVQAKELFSDWAKANRSVLMYKTITRADRLSADKARSMVKIRMENYAKRGDVDEFKDYLEEMEDDGLLVAEEVEFWSAEIDEFAQRWVHKQALEQVEAEALSILNESTVEAAIAFVREAITAPELTGADKRSLINLVEFFDRVNLYEDKRTKLEDWRKEIAEFTTQLREGKLDPRRIETSEHGVSHQTQWKDYLKNSMRAEPEVDWRKYLALEDSLFDHWNVDKTEYELAVVEARYGDKAIMGNTEFGILLKRVELDMPKQYMIALRTGFETISRDASKWKFGLRKLNQEEAQRVAQARAALLDWLLEDRVAKKKETSPEEFYSRAKQLAVLFQPRAAPSKREPEKYKPRTKLGNLADYLDTMKEEKPNDLLIDLRNAMKAVREGRDVNTVFRRILDTYKGRKDVSEFLATMVRPIVTEER